MSNFAVKFMQLPTELYHILFSYLTDIDIFLISLINKKINKLAPMRVKTSHEKFMTNIIKHNYLDLLIYYHQKGYNLPLCGPSMAVMYNRLDILKYLCNVKSKESENNARQWNDQLIYLASAFNAVDCFRYLSDQGYPVHHHCMDVACEKGNLAIIKYLHSQGHKLDNSVRFCLMICNGRLDCLKYVLEYVKLRDIYPFTDGKSPKSHYLRCAIITENKEVIDYLSSLPDN